MAGPSVWLQPLAEIQPTHEDTVRSWLNRYEQEGLPGLRVREGRGRKPLCSPGPSQYRNRRPPICKGGSTALRACMALSRAGFPLRGMQKEVPWLQHTRPGTPLSLPGICKLLKRLGVCYKRGRAHVHALQQKDGVHPLASRTPHHGSSALCAFL
jgi:hypothetical protein